MKRTSFTLPEDVVESLTLVSSRLGVSRSALVSQMLADVVLPFAEIFKQIPESPDGLSELDVKRFRGQSVELVRDRIKHAQERFGEDGDDLFSDL